MAQTVRAGNYPEVAGIHCEMLQIFMRSSGRPIMCGEPLRGHEQLKGGSFEAHQTLASKVRRKP